MMDKYTPEQLKEMAETTLEAVANGDPRGLETIMFSSILAGITPDEAVAKVRELAK